MRYITNTLLTAQTAASGRPHVRVEALDALAGVARTHFARVYDGDEDSYHHAATMPADGSLVRVRMAESDGALYVQRTPNPGPSSDFAAWTRLDTGATACNVAACSRGAMVLVAFRDPANPRAVCVRESADSGATWSDRRVAATLASGAVERLATSFSSAGAPALFLAATDARLHVTTRTGNVWSAPAAHNYALADVTGLAVDYDSVWQLAVTGSDATGAAATGRHRVWTASYDGAWSPLLEVTRADAGSGVTFFAPFLRIADVARLTVVERYTGAGGYQRPLLFNTLAETTFDANSWADPVPLDAVAPHGIAVAGTANALWLATPDGVWHAALDASPRDLSADVLSLTMRESPSGGSVTLALRNDDGRYDAVGHPASPIREGTEIRVSPGYVTPVGEEVSEGPAFWVTGWERRYGGGEATLVVHAGDGWALLAAWRARRQFAWTRGEAAIASILGFILQRVGLSLQSANPSDAMLAHRPAFTVHPGESGATAVRRLMAMAPDLLHFRGRIARLTLPQPTDASDYAFGNYHPVHHVRLAATAPDATRVQVFGAGVGEALDHRAIPLLGERLRQLNDLNQDTLAKAETHAANILARAQREARSGELQAPPNVALELHDVVAIHTPGANAVERLRVAALDLDYRRTGTPRYQQKITLTGL